jgi:hydroxymethylpyrimidine pyrophosphatase-like HAD family hydrolase|tara:strand:+ start:3032 stop:3220 length:189 start_codon:yes stop_codon:yes gene_type:complete
MSDNTDCDIGDITEAVRRAIQEAQDQGFVAVVVTGKVSVIWWHAVSEMLQEARQDMRKGRLR